MVHAVVVEARSALRYATRRPAFALTVTVTLAVAIAVAATAFGLARAVLWRELPFDDASRLVFVWEEVERDAQRHAARVTGVRHAAWRDSTGILNSVSLFGAAGFTLDAHDGATSVRGVRVSANYFDTLGINAALGRTFAREEELPGNHRVVILSDAFWRERLGGRREAIGETLRLNGEPYVIVGVMPGVTFPAWPVNPAIVTLDADARELWVPIQRSPGLDRSGTAHVFGVVARLAPGLSRAQAAERLSTVTDRTGADPHGTRLEPFREQLVRDARLPLLALAGAALAVLLIACANLAALYVSAFEARRTELAVRAAIGAGVSRLVRQLASEAFLLSAAGAAGGIVLTRIALAALPRVLPPSIPFLTQPTVDWRIAGFAVGLATLASIMFTAWPIARLVVTAPLPRGTAAPPRAAVYRALVISQVALAMALVVAAGLLTQSLQSVTRQQTGFATERVFVVDASLPASRPPSPQAIARAEQQVLEAIATRPGIRAVAAAYDHPLEANWSERPTISGHIESANVQRQAELRIVSPGYFEALDVQALDGRTFTERDTFDAPGVAVVNDAFAREIGGRVLGRRLRTGTPRFMFGAAAPADFEIVGIVDNERFRGLDRPAPAAFYLTTRQFPQSGVSLLVRTEGEPMDVAADVRRTLRAIDPRITFTRPAALNMILAEQLAPRRLTTDAISAFAAAALVLAALGIYGLLAMVVGSRRRELGVRLAIGASPSHVARQIVFDSMGTAAAGIVIGCGLAFAAGRFLQHLLVGVSPRDPVTLATVVLVLLVTAAVAAVLPALRAARIDPVEILHAE